MTLVDQFNGLEAKDIDRFIAEGREENLHLEFKTVNAADMDRVAAGSSRASV
jgi:hypothetical protein